MMILRAAAAALVAVAVAAGNLEPVPAEPATAVAVAAADAWLALVDAGRYGASWDEAATIFRDAVPRTQWDRSLKRVRAPLGSLVSRKVLSVTSTGAMPGQPDGKYVVVQYATRFASKQAAVETVTPMLDPDGTWRVSGYYVR